MCPIAEHQLQEAPLGGGALCSVTGPIVSRAKGVNVPLALRDTDTLSVPPSVLLICEREPFCRIFLSLSSSNSKELQKARLTWCSGMLLMHIVAMEVSTTLMERRLKSLLGME